MKPGSRGQKGGYTRARFEKDLAKFVYLKNLQKMVAFKFKSVCEFLKDVHPKVR